ncbi:MAG: flagellar motor switch protein FliM [Anaerolineales bacterium]|nr:flagellar motor switch protein FliM [Anaerolineales bacterium]
MLTQAEIDALLAGEIEVEQRDSVPGVNLAEIMESRGDAAPTQPRSGEKQVRPYNFWSPDRFSKDQMRAVEMIHEDLADRLSSSLPSFVRTDFRPHLAHSEQGRFDDFLRDLPTDTLFHLVKMEPLPGQIALTISPDVSWVILGRLLGGVQETKPSSGSITEIGQSLLQVTVEYMLNDVKAAWAKVVAIEPRLEDSTENQHWVQMVMSNARVMMITFELSIEDTTGSMSLYIPFSLLKPINDVLNPHAWISGREETRVDPQARRAVMEGLAQVEIPLRVDLGQTELTFSEIAHLQVGDVIRLDTKTNDELSIYVAGKKRIRGRAGRMGNQTAVRITSFIEKSKEVSRPNGGKHHE